MIYITPVYDISSFIKNIQHEDLSHYNIKDIPYEACIGNGAKLPLSLEYINSYGIYASYSNTTITYDGSMSSWRKILKQRTWCKFDNSYTTLTVICTDGDIKYKEVVKSGIYSIQEVS